MRLFVAVPLDDAVRRAAADLVDGCRRRAGHLSPNARITWVDPDRMHLTVRFIGQVADAVADAMRDALTPPVPLAPFACTIAGAGTFPGRGQPRVIWAGVTEGRAELAALEQAVSRRLEGIGVEPDPRPYRPHLTLARVRDGAGLRGDRLLDGLADVRLGRLMVRAVTLFESRLSPNGPAYLPLLETPLAF